MKPRILIALIAVTALLLVFSPSVQAQQQLLFRVDVPFEFIAGGVHLPSGQYLAFHTSPSMLELVNRDGRASAWIPVKASPVAKDGDGPNEIVFNRYGDTYFLSKVRTAHDQQVHECFRCQGEKTLAAQYRSSEVKTVTLAAK